MSMLNPGQMRPILDRERYPKFFRVCCALCRSVRVVLEIDPGCAKVGLHRLGWERSNELGWACEGCLKFVESVKA